jgi:prenyltransferase beta subunit
MRRPVLALAVLVGLGAPAARSQDTEPNKALTVAYLQGLQQPDGGFLPAPGGPEAKSSLRATSACVRALKYFGGAPKDRDAAVAFVKKCYDPAAGAFADRPGGKPDVPTAAVGMMALVALGVDVPLDYKTAVMGFLMQNAKGFEEVRLAAAGCEAMGLKPANAAAWLEVIRQTANPEGSFGKGDGVARDTGGAAAAILRLGGQLENREAVVKAFKDGQRADGGFGKAGEKDSDLETTYRVMRSFHMLKEKPDVERCRAFVARCRQADGGYGIAPGRPSGAGPTYYAASILGWLEK